MIQTLVKLNQNRDLEGVKPGTRKRRTHPYFVLFFMLHMYTCTYMVSLCVAGHTTVNFMFDCKIVCICGPLLQANERLGGYQIYLSFICFILVPCLSLSERIYSCFFLISC